MEPRNLFPAKSDNCPSEKAFKMCAGNWSPCRWRASRPQLEYQKIIIANSNRIKMVKLATLCVCVGGGINAPNHTTSQNTVAKLQKWCARLPKRGDAAPGQIFCCQEGASGSPVWYEQFNSIFRDGCETIEHNITCQGTSLELDGSLCAEW